MELAKVERGGALVKKTSPQDAVAAGLGAVGLIHLALPVLVPVPYIFILAASIGAVLLTWESVANKEKRSLVAMGAFAMGVVPLAWVGIGLAAVALGFALKMLILAVVIGGGVYIGGRALAKKKARSD